MEATFALKPPQVAEISELTLTPKIERNLTEELQVRRRFVALAGQITKHRLRILQQGATGIDLVGTSQIDVTMDLGERTPVQVYSFNLETTESGKRPKLSKAWQRHPILLCDVKAKVHGKYRVRKVASGKGDDTVIEGDDVARFVESSIPEFGVTIVPADETVTVGFKLSRTDREIQITNQSAPTAADYEPMTFASAENGQAMLEWLHTQDLSNDVTITSGGTYRMRVRNLQTKGVENLTKAELNDTRVVPVFRPKCKTAE